MYLFQTLCMFLTSSFIWFLGLLKIGGNYCWSHIYLQYRMIANRFTVRSHFAKVSHNNLKSYSSGSTPICHIRTSTLVTLWFWESPEDISTRVPADGSPFLYFPIIVIPIPITTIQGMSHAPHGPQEHSDQCLPDSRTIAVVALPSQFSQRLECDLSY